MSSQVFRPRRLRIWALTAAVVVVVATVGVGVALGGDVRALFTPGQVLTLAVLLALTVAVLVGLAQSDARVDDAGVRWRNVFRSHRLGWHEIVGVRYRPGDPWAYLLTAGPAADDPVRHPLMAIQSTDGIIAVDEATRLRELWAAHRG